jgi:uncharacterized protein with HEPN domain
MTKIPRPLIASCFDALEVIISRAGTDKNRFFEDDILRDSILMRIIESAEYVTRIREDFPDFYELESRDSWNKLIALRNIAAHSYLNVDMEIIWGLTQTEFPQLAEEMRKLF